MDPKGQLCVLLGHPIFLVGEPVSLFNLFFFLSPHFPWSRKISSSKMFLSSLFPWRKNLGGGCLKICASIWIISPRIGMNISNKNMKPQGCRFGPKNPSRQTLVKHQYLDPAIGTICGGERFRKCIYRGQICNLEPPPRNDLSQGLNSLYWGWSSNL